MALNIAKPQVGGSSPASLSPFLSLAELLLKRKWEADDRSAAEQGMQEYYDRERNKMVEQADLTAPATQTPPENLTGGLQGLLASTAVPKPGEVSPLTVEEEKTILPPYGEATHPQNLDQLLQQVPTEPQGPQDFTPAYAQNMPISTTEAGVPQRIVPRGQTQGTYGALAQKVMTEPRNMKEWVYQQVKDGLMTYEEGVQRLKQLDKQQKMRTVVGQGGKYYNIDPYQLGEVTGPSGQALAKPEMGSLQTDAQGNVVRVPTMFGSTQQPEMTGVRKETTGDKWKARLAEKWKGDFMPVIDSHTNQPMMVSKAQMMADPDPYRYVPAGPYREALNQRAFSEDIRSNINATRRLLDDPKLPEFDSYSAALIAGYLGDPTRDKSMTFLQSMLQQKVGKQMTPEQLAYVTRLLSLSENALSLRTLQKMGVGASDQRAAIRNLLPNATTTSKQHAHEQLNMLESTLNSVERGFLKVRLGAPSPIVSGDRGITPDQQLNLQWDQALDEMEARGLVWDNMRREWLPEAEVPQENRAKLLPEERTALTGTTPPAATTPQTAPTPPKVPTPAEMGITEAAGAAGPKPTRQAGESTADFVKRINEWRAKGGR